MSEPSVKTVAGYVYVSPQMVEQLRKDMKQRRMDEQDIRNDLRVAYGLPTLDETTTTHDQDDGVIVGSPSLEDWVDQIRADYGDDLDVLRVDQRIGEPPQISVRLRPRAQTVVLSIMG
jgi:hypothetical protein